MSNKVINNRFLCLIVGLSLMMTVLNGSRESSSEQVTLKEVAVVSAGVAVGAASCYLLARLCSAGIYSVALYRYEAELDLLLRSIFNEQVLQEELIPFILEQHDRNNTLYFFIHSKYKNYPLLYYKNNLDWYIRRLWLSEFLYFNVAVRNQIDILMQKLERIRRLVVTDYRFVQEQRDFDLQSRKV